MIQDWLGWFNGISLGLCLAGIYSENINMIIISLIIWTPTVMLQESHNVKES